MFHMINIRNLKCTHSDEYIQQWLFKILTYTHCNLLLNNIDEIKPKSCMKFCPFLKAFSYFTSRTTLPPLDYFTTKNTAVGIKFYRIGASIIKVTDITLNILLTSNLSLILAARILQPGKVNTLMSCFLDSANQI